MKTIFGYLTDGKLFFAACITLLVGCVPSPKNETELTNIQPILIGTYTDGLSEGIYQVSFDKKEGGLSNLRLVAESTNPSFLTVNNSADEVFAVTENDPGGLVIYARQPNGELIKKSQLPTEGIHPCHVALNGDQNLVSVANYSSGNVSLFQKTKESWALIHQFQHEGTGPNKDRQEGPHAHFNTFRRDNTLYAVDLGTDKVMGYKVLSDTTIDSFVAHQAEPGDGPRHLVFHPSQNFVFVVNELTNTVTSHRVTPEGTFSLIDRIDMLPEGFSAYSKAADIHLSENGKYLYASNRGHNSIVIYEVSDEGELELVGWQSEGIKTPRNFTLSPEGNHLLVANQDANNIIVFAVEKDGTLSPTEHQIEVGSPVCLVFVP